MRKGHPHDDPATAEVVAESDPETELLYSECLLYGEGTRSKKQGTTVVGIHGLRILFSRYPATAE